MDAAVIRAMAKWPDVPAVFGWLSLDRRGRWCLQGEPIAHPPANAFIDRNYTVDGRGRWYFQNGPQRVFVQLAYTPWVYFVSDMLCIRTHTARAARALQGAWLDDKGQLVLLTDLGVGLVCDRDLARIATAFCTATGVPCDDLAIEAALSRSQEGSAGTLYLKLLECIVPVGAVHESEVAARFGFVSLPHAAPSRRDGS